MNELNTVMTLVFAGQTHTPGIAYPHSTSVRNRGRVRNSVRAYMPCRKGKAWGGRGRNPLQVLLDQALLLDEQVAAVATRF